ncbi:MAG: hypothetical protein ACKOAU_07570 [Pirellula sp.]
MNPLNDWLAELSDPMPLSFRNPNDPVCLSQSESLRQALKQSSTPSGGVLEALAYLRIGLMEPAHGNVQDATLGIEAYVHGVIHRMEGDYWNAKYWFARVQDAQLLTSIAKHIEELGSAPGILAQEWTGPESFVNACQARRSAPNDALVDLAWLEWQALWRIAKEKNPR